MKNHHLDSWECKLWDVIIVNHQSAEVEEESVLRSGIPYKLLLEFPSRLSAVIKC